MPTPCPPHAYGECFGPYRVGLDVTLPYGYEDRLVPCPPDQYMIKVSEVGLALTQAFDQHPAEVAIPLGNRAAETVWCGTDPLVYQGSPLHREAEDGPDPSTGWVVQVWVYAPNAPTDVPLDYAYLATRWAATLIEVPIPERSRPAYLTTTDTTYLVNGRFTGLLPRDYEPSTADQSGNLFDPPPGYLL